MKPHELMRRLVGYGDYVGHDLILWDGKPYQLICKKDKKIHTQNLVPDSSLCCIICGLAIDREEMEVSEDVKLKPL